MNHTQSVAVIGGGAVVNQDVPDYAMVVGVPTRQTGWMSRHGERLDLPISGGASATFPHTDETYILDGVTPRLDSASHAS